MMETESFNTAERYWLRERKDKPTVYVEPLGRPLLTRRQILSRLIAKQKLETLLHLAESTAPEQQVKKPSRKSKTSSKSAKHVTKKKSTQAKASTVAQKGIGRLKRQEMSVKALTKSKPKAKIAKPKTTKAKVKTTNAKPKTMKAKVTAAKLKMTKSKKAAPSKPQRTVFNAFERPSTSKHVRFQTSAPRPKSRNLVTSKSVSSSSISSSNSLFSSSSSRSSASNVSSRVSAANTSRTARLASRSLAATSRSSGRSDSSLRSDSTLRSDSSNRSSGPSTRRTRSNASVGSKCNTMAPNRDVDVKPNVDEMPRAKDGDVNNA